MGPHTVDEFLASINGCSSTEQLFSLYRAEIEREGFHNVVFIRQAHTTIVEIPYLSVPEGALEVYLEQNLAEHDPMVRLVGNRTPAFTWNEMEQQCVTKAERDTLGVCREIGCTGGYAMPFYGPHGMSDVFDITFREKASFNPARNQILSIKSYATWLRFLELDSVTITQRVMQPSNGQPSNGQPSKKQNGSKHARRPCAQHNDGHECITADECRALVVCDIAMRRYKAALTELNDGLQHAIGAEMFRRLRARGLLLDVPDDDNMRFYYQPSPIAVAHLRRCAHVADVRNQAWRLHARADERPAEWW